MPAHPDHEFLCPHHAKIQQRHAQAPREDSLLHEFARARAGGYTTQIGLNHALCSVFEALADNRISPKRATSLAYIWSLLMRSQPKAQEEAEDWERAAQIHDDILQIKYPHVFGELGEPFTDPPETSETETSESSAEGEASPDDEQDSVASPEGADAKHQEVSH